MQLSLELGLKHACGLTVDSRNYSQVFMFWIHTKACSVPSDSITYDVKYNKMRLQYYF